MENAYVLNMTLQAQTPLANYVRQFGQTSLKEHSGVSIYSIALALRSDDALASIQSALGSTWPKVGHSTSNATGTHRLLGLQSDQVFALVTSEQSKQSNGASTPLPTLHSDAYVTDQSDSWAGLIIEGPSARIALERICPTDLHPSVFTTDRVTRTSMEHLAVIVYHAGEDKYLLLSPSSSAQSFLHAVETSLQNI